MSINRCFAIAAIMLTYVSCNKKSDNSQLTLEGKWELATVESSWVGRQTYPRGNGNTFIFKNGTYAQNIHYADTSYQITGTFSVFQGKPCEQSNEQTLIQFDSTQTPQTFTFSGTTFTIALPPTCFIDGGSSTYRKIFF